MDVVTDLYHTWGTASKEYGLGERAIYAHDDPPTPEYHAMQKLR